MVYYFYRRNEKVEASWVYSGIIVELGEFSGVLLLSKKREGRSEWGLFGCTQL